MAAAKKPARPKTKAATTAAAVMTNAADAPVPPMKPPPFVVTPELVTGIYDSGDVLENLLDELRSVLMAANRLLDGRDDEIGNLIPMALRKTEAAVKVYLYRDDEPATKG